MLAARAGRVHMELNNAPAATDPNCGGRRTCAQKLATVSLLPTACEILAFGTITSVGGAAVRRFFTGLRRPRKRIADLERQLAQPRPVTGEPGAATTGGWLTAEQVRTVAFSKPPNGKRGYNEDEVDAFLGLVERQVSAGPGASTPPAAGFTPPPAGPSAARHPAGETWAGRTWNVVVGFYARRLDSTT
jgi:DivIVA domain-containing protein